MSAWTEQPVARRDPHVPADPYALPHPTNDPWYDLVFGPWCRRMCAKYGLVIEGERATPAPTPATLHTRVAGALPLDTYAATSEAVGAALPRERRAS